MSGGIPKSDPRPYFPEVTTPIPEAWKDVFGPDFGLSLDFDLTEGFDAGWPRFSSMTELELPTLNMDELVALIGATQNELNGVRVASSGQQLKLQRAQRDIDTDRMLKKIDEIARKIEESIKKQQETKVANWFAAVFGLIGAVLGVALAFGVTGGVAAAGALIGLALAVTQVVNMAVNEAGVKADISFGGLAKAACAGIQDETLKQQRIQEIELALNMIAMAAVLLLTGGAGVRQAIMQIKGVAKGVGDETAGEIAKLFLREAGDNLKEMSKKMEVLVQAIAVLTDIGEGSSHIVKAQLQIKIADIIRDSEYAKADKERLAAFMEIMTIVISRLGEVIKEAGEGLNASYSFVSDLIADLNDTRSYIARDAA